MKTRIKVTWDDIKKGVAKNCATCPVARAVTKKLKPNLTGYVRNVLVISLRQFDLTVEALRFIRDFDIGLPVQPFHFDLDLPAEFLKA